MDCEANRESIRLKNFPIREFVSSIREKDPEKCWPFGSLCAYKDFAESISLVNLNISEDGEAPELSEGEISEGKEAGSDTSIGFEHEIPTANETGSDTATGFVLEISKGKEIASGTARALQLQISKGKNSGFETAAGLELEISKGNDIGYGTTTGNADNLNKFAIDIEDNSDNGTLGLFLKKRKDVKVTHCALNEKRKSHQVEKPRPKSVKRPNFRPEGSRTMTKKPRSTEKLAEGLHSVEVKMAMAKRKRSRSPVAERGFGAGGSKGPGTRLMITVNRNPADFSAPGPGNRFMRRGDSE